MTGDESLIPALAGLEIREAMARVARRLDDCGIEIPSRDARLLVGAALGLDSADLIREPARPLDAAAAARLAGFVARRAAHEPVSRILGVRGFYGRTFEITPATLDPRPATETLVDAALEIADRNGWRTRPMRILDVGTGSGALILTLLAELPLATGTGTDISEGALAVARRNAERLGLAARCSFVLCRSLEGVAETFDLLVSNPPYIPTGDIAGLDADVRDYDPRAALDGGADGLAIYRELALGLVRIVPEGVALLEVGAGQAEAVADIFRHAAGAALAGSESWKDLGSHTRAVAVMTHRYPRR